MEVQCKVSVIIPVYNVEKYLEKCLLSIKSQTLKEFEAIIIDDGSKDGSGEKCEEICKIDSRFRVFHQENMGLSMARNKGIEIAKGEFLAFIDSDDWIEEDFLEILYTKAKETKSEIACCGINEVSEKTGSTHSWTKNDESETIFSRNEAFLNYLSLRENQIMTVAWNKIYKRELFDGIRYPQGKLFEDEYTTYKLLYRAKKVFYTGKHLYNYLKRDTSISSVYHNERYQYLIESQEQLLKFLVKEKNKLLYKRAYARYICMIRDQYYGELKKQECSEEELKRLRSLIVKNYKIVLKSNILTKKKELAFIISIVFPQLYEIRMKRRG